MQDENSRVEFGVFDERSDVRVDYRCLPHWFQPGAATFITFRTADSLPEAVIDRLRKERRDWMVEHDLEPDIAGDAKRIAALPKATRFHFRKYSDTRWNRMLDDCLGECVLRQPVIAKIVVDAILHFDNDRYDIDSLIVMPNHVHLIVQFREGTTLRKQSESWLHFTAVQINKQIGRTGQFWQSEPFDHIIRSAEQFTYLRRYISDNPSKANLEAGQSSYWSRDLNRD